MDCRSVDQRAAPRQRGGAHRAQGDGRARVPRRSRRPARQSRRAVRGGVAGRCRRRRGAHPDDQQAAQGIRRRVALAFVHRDDRQARLSPDRGCPAMAGGRRDIRTCGGRRDVRTGVRRGCSIVVASRAQALARDDAAGPGGNGHRDRRRLFRVPAVGANNGTGGLRRGRIPPAGMDRRRRRTIRVARRRPRAGLSRTRNHRQFGDGSFAPVGSARNPAARSCTRRSRCAGRALSNDGQRAARRRKPARDRSSRRCANG